MAAAAMLLASCFAAAAEPKKISIANFGDHPALVEVVDGFKARMTELGYAEGTDVSYQYRHVNFDRTLLPQLLQQTEADDPDLIFVVTTGVAQASIRGIKDKSIPIVFASVVDPVVAGIVPDWQRGSETHAGASMLPDFESSLDFVKQVIPGAKRIGTIFNPGEDNDTTNMKLITEAAARAGVEIEAVAVDNANDLPQRVQSFAGKVDAIFLIQSNIVQTAVPVVAQVAQRIKVPLFNSVYSEELKHQLAGFHAISYARNGSHAADIADRVLKGEGTASIPTYTPVKEDFDSFVSPKGLEAVGLSVPDALKDSPWIIE
jgi:putative ABC transport system substrate-binding protein